MKFNQYLRSRMDPTFVGKCVDYKRLKQSLKLGASSFQELFEQELKRVNDAVREFQVRR